jgi:low temperature requirement protein LtrA
MSDVAPLVAEPTHAEEERKTSYLELVFDLVFVVSFTQVTALILEDTSVQGFARATLVLAMVWWAWSAHCT